MRQSQSITNPFRRKQRGVAAFLFCLACPCATAGSGTLPNLPGADQPPPLQWQLDEQGAALAFETPFEKWEAKIDQDGDGRAALAFDYGLLLTSQLGAGATFRHDGDYAEVVANAVYAHRRNVRFRLAGAQLRTGQNSPRTFDHAVSFQQNSYLLSARKYWPIERFVSNLGIAVYTVDAVSSAATLRSLQDKARALEADEDLPSSIASGKMNGFALNLGLHPTWQSRIELWREFSHFDYRPHSGLRRNEFHSAGRISYQHYLDNCVRIRGSYSIGSDAGRLDLGFAKGNWSVSLSQDFTDTTPGTALYASFSIPLDGRVMPESGCASDSAPSFAPVMEAALQRPQQFPHEPITVTIVE